MSETNSNLYSIDARIGKRRGSGYLANMLMSTENTTKPMHCVITMRVRKDLNSDPSESDPRFVFLCEETKASHIVQMYSGEEVPGASREAVFYKGTANGDVIFQPVLGVKFLGSADEFLKEHLDIADAIAEEGKILADQLTLCRAVHHMVFHGGTPAQALSAAGRSNEEVIQLQKDLGAAVEMALQGN